MRKGCKMNEKFFSLPEKKQQAIINAGFRVFSRNSYKNSPMSEIAADAGISKSLLFYYFRNKKELYLFLWEKCAEFTVKALAEYGCYAGDGLFESMEKGLKAKIALMREYPDMSFFALKVFYEKDPDISAAVRESCDKHFNFKTDSARLNFAADQFLPDIDPEMMYREMFLASEGYMWEALQRGDTDIDKMESDFTEMMRFWKSIFLKKD